MVDLDTAWPFPMGATFETVKRNDCASPLKFLPSSMVHLSNVNIVCVGGYNGTFVLFDSETLEIVYTYTNFSQDAITDLKYYEKANLLIIFSNNIKIVKILPNKRLQTMRILSNCSTHNQFVGISESDGYLFTSSPSHRVNVYTLNSLTCKKKFSVNKTLDTQSKPRYCYIDSAKLIIVSYGFHLQGYHAISGKVLWTQPILTEARTVLLSFCSKTNSIVCISEDGEITIWSVTHEEDGVICQKRFINSQVRGITHDFGVKENNLFFKQNELLYSLNLSRNIVDLVSLEEADSEFIVLTEVDKDNVFMLDWVQGTLTQVQYRSQNTFQTPRKVLRKIDNWFKKKLSSFLVSLNPL